MFNGSRMKLGSAAVKVSWIYGCMRESVCLELPWFNFHLLLQCMRKRVSDGRGWDKDSSGVVQIHRNGPCGIYIFSLDGTLVWSADYWDTVKWKYFAQGHNTLPSPEIKATSLWPGFQHSNNWECQRDGLIRLGQWPSLITQANRVQWVRSCSPSWQHGGR